MDPIGERLFLDTCFAELFAAHMTGVNDPRGRNDSVDQGLASTIAQFRTPTLRDLEDSQPYLHNGGKLALNDVAEFYVDMSQLARQGLLRNPPPEFGKMSLSQDDIDALVAFLKSLTEDYDDT